MQKDTYAATIEFTEDWLEGCVAYIRAIDVGEENETVDVEVVTAVCNLGD